jgi:hypothetical protein
MLDHYTMHDYRMMNRLRSVPRWCVVPTLRKQNVAEHTFHVMVICDWLLEHHRYRSDHFHLDVLRLALGHDRDESITGDIAAGSKPIPTDEDVSKKTDAQIVLKVADYLEAILFLEDERRLGNAVYPEPIIEDAITRMRPYWRAFPFKGYIPKPDARALVGLASRLFFDPATVHPVFETVYGEASHKQYDENEEVSF